MGEIKSAWEIAMEKVGNLDELTIDELKKQEEEKYTLIGQALAEKYIEVINLRQLNIELDKYSDEERKLLSRIVASRLLSAIQLGDYERLDKVVKGISYLNQKELPVEPVEEIKGIFREYNEAKEKSREKMGSAADILLQLGISGTAIVEVNIKAVVESPQVLDQIAKPFHDRIERLKQKLWAPPVK